MLEQILSPAGIAAITALVGAISTLIATLKTHADVQAVKVQTNGKMDKITADVQALKAAQPAAAAPAPDHPPAA